MPLIDCDRFEPMGRRQIRPAIEGEYPQQLQQGFQTKLAGPNGILKEMGFEEPGFRVHIDRTMYESELVRPAVGKQAINSVYHPKLSIGQRRPVRDFLW